MEHAWRQGDVIVVEVKIPKGAEPIEHDGVLAYGEATGHRHQLVAGPDSRIRYFRDATQDYFEVVSGFADLRHEGHFDHRFPKGVYSWHRQREADWVNEATRNVND